MRRPPPSGAHHQVYEPGTRSRRHRCGSGDHRGVELEDETGLAIDFAIGGAGTDQNTRSLRAAKAAGIPGSSSGFH
ncbi:MAG: hypothetical protein ABSF98_17330 [Bryobacteraceae bacterium]